MVSRAITKLYRIYLKSSYNKIHGSKSLNFENIISDGKITFNEFDLLGVCVNTKHNKS